MDELQEKMFDALVDVCRPSDVSPSSAMGAAIGAALKFILCVSEVAGRNQLRDLYNTRRIITDLITIYKEDKAK